MILASNVPNTLREGRQTIISTISTESMIPTMLMDKNNINDIIRCHNIERGLFVKRYICLILCLAIILVCPTFSVQADDNGFLFGHTLRNAFAYFTVGLIQFFGIFLGSEQGNGGGFHHSLFFFH